jgi:hypothetical protein
MAPGLPDCICVCVCLLPCLNVGTHDTTVLLFLLALDIFDGVWPPYCANITFELVDVGGEAVVAADNRYRIRVLYNLQPVVLRIADDVAHPDTVSLGTTVLRSTPSP